jgi:hypothetical protein
MGADLMLTTDLIQAIDERVRQGQQAEHQVGTVVERTTGSSDAAVVFDGSQGTIAVKVAGNVDAGVGDRVLLARYATWWIVVGTMRSVYDSGQLIQETVLEQPAATVTFAGIPQTWRHLALVVHARSTGAGSSPIDTTIRFNGDSGLHYSGAHLDLPMGGALGIATGHDLAQASAFMVPASGVSSGVAGGGFCWIANYSDDRWRTKPMFLLTSASDFGSIGDHKVRWATWCPLAPDPVVQIDVTCASGSFDIDSYFGLYGQGL